MNRTASVLLIVVMLFTISLAAVWNPVIHEPESGTRAEFGGLVVSSNIDKDTAWNMRNSSFPYDFVYIEKNITVLPDVNLTIMPGTIVKFKYRASLTIDGTLIADGEIFKPIQFIPIDENPGTLDWQGIKFQNESVNSVMNYVNIEYADGGIAIYGSSPIISNCTIHINFYYGILVGENSNPVIRDNLVNFTQWAGIICENNSMPSIIDNVINECYYGIICYDAAEVVNNEIEACFIGIMCWGDANVTGNNLRNCRDGIQSFYSSPLIENNNIVWCTGNGTRFMGSDAIIKNNVLWNNEVGMDISYDAKDILNNMEGNLVNGIDIETCFYVGQKDLVIDGLEVDSGWNDGYYGSLTAQGTVTLYDCPNVVFRNCNISNSHNAIYATNSTFNIYNTEFYNFKRSQVFLDNNATGWAYNGSVNPYNVTIGGPICGFTTYDEIEVMVRDYYQEPIPNLNVVVRESQLVLHNVTTNETGLTGSMLVKDSAVSEAGVIPSPLSITIYTDKYNFNENPIVGVYARETDLVTFTDLGDIFSPEILTCNVEDGNRFFPVNGSITIQFDEPMDQASAEQAFSISGNVTGTITWQGFNMTFTPDALEYQTDYLIVVSTDAMDLWGNNLDDPASYSFTTEEAPGTSNNTMLIAVIAIFAIAGIGGFFMFKKISQ